jgi:hypothetical protein
VKNCWPAKPRLRRPSQRVRRDLSCGAGTRAPRSRRVNSGRRHRWRCRTVRTWTHTGSLGTDPGAHAVEFSKTAAPSREGDSFADGAPERETRGAGLVSIAPISRPEGPQSGADPTGRGRIARWARNGSVAAPTAGMPRADGLGPPRSGPRMARAERRRAGSERRTAAGRRRSADGRVRLRQHRHRHHPLPRAIVEVDQDDLLPRAESELAAHDRHGLRRPITAARRCACALVSWLRTLC